MTRTKMANVAERRLRALGFKDVSVKWYGDNREHKIFKPYFEAHINGRCYFKTGGEVYSGMDLAYYMYGRWFEDFMGVPLAMSYGTWKRSSNFELRRAQNGK